MARSRRHLALIRFLGAAMAAGLLLTPAAARAQYWTVFNVEGERALSAQLVTYATRADMLQDANRTGVHTPNPSGFGVNIVGGGAFVASVSTIPEPGTVALTAIGLLGLGLLGRRRRGAGPTPA